MNSNMLFLKFKDTTSPIDFDLNKNTVFFGNNGRGKTRVLKTINSLYKLDKKRRVEELSEIISSMHLEDLAIDGVSYKDLFDENESLRLDKYKRSENHFEEYLPLLIRLSELYIEIENREYEYISYKLKRYRAGSVLKKIYNTNFKRQIYMGDFFRDPESYESFISSLKRVLREFYRFNSDIRRLEMVNLKDENDTLSLIEEFNYHVSNYCETFDLMMINEDKETLYKMEDIKEKIISNLSSKSSHYISTDNIDVSGIIRKIENHIKFINEHLKEWYWHIDSIDSETDLEKVNSLKEELELKINKYNKFMNKYGAITITYNHKAEIVFNKGNSEIEFEKLSSGERKISYLFLEILFNDVDIYLIDEPELSVSLDFQNKIVTDIHYLTKGKIVFIATHAPFVFNDFKNIEGNLTKEVR